MVVDVRHELVKEAAILLKESWKKDLTSPSIPVVRETMKRRGRPLTAAEEKLMVRLAATGL